MPSTSLKGAPATIALGAHASLVISAGLLLVGGATIWWGASRRP